jgi:hypothetical protein
MGKIINVIISNKSCKVNLYTKIDDIYKVEFNQIIN